MAERELAMRRANQRAREQREAAAEAAKVKLQDEADALNNGCAIQDGAIVGYTFGKPLARRSRASMRIVRAWRVRRRGGQHG